MRLLETRTWTVERQHSGRLVAWCDALGLTVEGDSALELKSVIREAEAVLAADLIEEGDAERFLADRSVT